MNCLTGLDLFGQARPIDNPRPDSRLEFPFVFIHVEPELVCHCRSFRFSHSPEAHRQLRADYDWRSFDERRPTFREG